MDSPRKFVCAINGARDDYQVPLALAEAGLLHRFVTDFYMPAGPVARLFPRSFRRRQIEGLAPRLVRSLPLSFAWQSLGRLLRLAMQPIYARTDAMLAQVAGRIARRGHSALYCYHMYVPPEIPGDLPLVVFVYHPRAAAERRILAADAERFPEVVDAFAREARVTDPPVDWNRADAVVCASTFTAESVIAEGCDPGKITVIPYGLPELGNADIPPNAARTQPPRFLFVGQGVQRKGLHHLIRAWQSQDRGSARLTIVSYRIEPAIAALINDPSITVLGYQDRTELGRLFAAADVFIMPSLVEGFGLVYLEALAHGCHIIGTPNSGLPALNLPQSAATLVEPGNIEALDAAITSAIAASVEQTFDRDAIRQVGRGWTQSAFRKAIADHARQVLERSSPNRKGTFHARIPA